MDLTLDDRTWAQTAHDLAHDADLRRALTDRIAAHEAVFFECVPVSRATRHEPFRFLLIDSPAVARLRPDPTAFAAHLHDPVSAFDNLGHDARLVAPGGAVPAGCAHLAAWARTAPDTEVHALWSTVATEVTAWWIRTDAPVWVSTSGLGVPWLHVRLDQRPKYVTHGPYRRWPLP